jgi:hypothetical protein
VRTLLRLASALLLAFAVAAPVRAETSSWMQETPQTEVPKTSPGKGVKLMPAPKAAPPATFAPAPGQKPGPQTMVTP